MAKVLRCSFALLLLTIFFPLISKATDIPPSTSKTQVAASPHTETDGSNKTGNNEDRQIFNPSLPKSSSRAEAFYTGALSRATKEDSESNPSEIKPVEKNREKKAVLQLSAVRSKSGGKVSEQSMGPQKIAALKEKREERLNSNKNNSEKNYQNPNETPKIQLQEDPDKSKDSKENPKEVSKENQGLNQDHGKDKDYNIPQSGNVVSSSVNKEENWNNESDEVRKKRIEERLKTLKAKLEGRIKIKTKSVQQIEAKQEHNPIT